MCMKGFIVLADGFEDVEGIATIDILKRAGIDLDLVSFHKNKKVLTSSNIQITLDFSLDEIRYETYDFFILPGGRAVFQHLDSSYEIAKIITHFCEKKKLICAICAAPSLIGKLGYLRDKEYCVFPGCGDKIVHGKKSDKPVVVDQNIITARSMYYSCDFALEIVAYLLGKEKAEQVKKQIQGRNEE